MGMEKQGVIRPGLTPRQDDSEVKAASQADTKKGQIRQLDDDLTKRLADSAAGKLK